MDLNVETLKKLDADQVANFQTYQTLTTAARESTAPGKSAERSRMAAFLAAELNVTDPGGKNDKGNDKPAVQRYSAKARRQIARVLEIVAGNTEVPALAAAIEDMEIREAARCALDRVRTDAATDALIAALNEVGPEFRTGVIGSLGDRGGEKAVKALQALADDTDDQVRVAALNALNRRTSTH